MLALRFIVFECQSNSVSLQYRFIVFICYLCYLFIQKIVIHLWVFHSIFFSIHVFTFIRYMFLYLMSIKFNVLAISCYSICMFSLQILNFDQLTLFFLWFHQYPLVVVQEEFIRFICINAKLMCFLFVRKEVKVMDKKMFVTSLIFKITWDYEVCIKLKAATEQPVWFDLFVFLKKEEFEC